MSAELDSRRTILPYLVGLMGLCLALQVLIAARGHQLDLLAEVGTAVVAVYYAVYLIRDRRALSHIRFGALTAHAVSYLVVNLSFHLHAALLVLTNSDAIRGDAHFPLDPGWFGVLLGMSCLWGLGLVVHAVASIAKRGYEGLA